MKNRKRILKELDDLEKSLDDFEKELKKEFPLVFCNVVRKKVVTKKGEVFYYADILRDEKS